MNRPQAPKGVENMYSLRVSNIGMDTDDEVIRQEFSKFGEVVDFYRPINLAHRKKEPTRHIFVRYMDPYQAEYALDELHGKEVAGHKLIVEPATQTSLFSNDTGYLTNVTLDEPPEKVVDFDPRMPPSHYTIKRAEALKKADEVYTVRIDEVSCNATEQSIREAFSQYGEISSIYHPMNLKTRKRMNFAFVRFIDRRSAEAAAMEMEGASVPSITSRNINVSIVRSQTYFSQNEDLASFN